MTIVHMNDFESSRRRTPTQEATEILRHCREMASKHLGEALQRMMGRVDDALFELAEKAESDQVRNHYFDAMREIRLKRQEIEADYAVQLVEGFNARIRGELPGRAAATQKVALENLDLVDNEELEESVAVTNMVTRIRTDHRDEVNALDRRMAWLLGDPDMDLDRNPLGPRMICEAFRTATRCIDAGIKVKLIVLKLFERFVVTEDVGLLYRNVNAYLIEQGILPTIRFSARRRPGGPTGAGVGLAGAGDPLATEGEDLFGTLESLLTPAPGPAGGLGPGAAPVAGAMPAGGGLPLVMGRLTALQQQVAVGGGGPADGAGGQVAGPADGDALVAGAAGGTGAASGNGVVLVGPGGMPVNVIRDVKQRILSEGGALAQADQMVIDVVAMLFDYILDDDAIPGPIRALIGRLQIPLLKVAMLDRGFFSSKRHPARRLLDRLAEVGIGWTEDDQGLYRQMEAAVERVLAEFEEDPSVFSEVLEALETYLAEERRQQPGGPDDFSRLVENRERVEKARQEIHQLISRQLEDVQVPAFVEPFLRFHWHNLLLIIHLRDGRDSLAWKKATATMANLVWSLTPKEQGEEQERLARLLPGLLGSLQEGMDLIAMPAEARERFLNQLGDHHAAAVRGMPAPVPPTLDDPLDQETEASDDEAELSIPDALVELLEESDIDIEEITLDTEVTLDDIDDEFTEQVRRLQVGDWVAFEQEDGTQLRAKLTWISPVTGIYLFTNRKGLKAAEKTQAGLAAELRRGSASLIEGAPLVDRALSHMIEGLRGQAAAG